MRLSFSDYLHVRRFPSNPPRPMPPPMAGSCPVPAPIVLPTRPPTMAPPTVPATQPNSALRSTTLWETRCDWQADKANTAQMTIVTERFLIFILQVYVYVISRGAEAMPRDSWSKGFKLESPMA